MNKDNKESVSLEDEDFEEIFKEIIEGKKKKARSIWIYSLLN